MPSPFPGMNPYLEHEDVWHSFNEHFPSRVLEMLTSRLTPNYFARIDSHVYIHEVPGNERRLWGRPDVGIGLATRGRSYELSGLSQTAKVAPRRVVLPAVDVEESSFLEIRDRRNRKLITVIELLSPSNKSGPDRDQYEMKRKALLRSSTHLVEIDLLRAGRRLPPADELSCDYCVLISRANDRPNADLFGWNLRDRMPLLPIPLAEGDSPADLDLQSVLD